MYTTINFKSKKALKDAVAAGKNIGVFQPNQMVSNPAADDPNYSGPATVEGPWYPKPHSWYGTVTLDKGRIVKVK